MFEVGKKYKTKYSCNYICLAVIRNGAIGWLQVEHEPNSQPTTYTFVGFENKWQEVLPEPKRWSVWQNLYDNGKALKFGGVAHNYYCNTKNEAIVIATLADRGYTALCLIRSDWEQHEGQKPKLVKIELEFPKELAS